MTQVLLYHQDSPLLDEAPKHVPTGHRVRLQAGSVWSSMTFFWISIILLSLGVVGLVAYKSLNLATVFQHHQGGGYYDQQYQPVLGDEEDQGAGYQEHEALFENPAYMGYGEPDRSRPSGAGGTF